MSTRPTICLPALLGCLLAISAVGCQSFPPQGYGAYPGSYNSYPAYQPGTVVPYNGVPGGVVQPGTIYQQPGMYPQQGGHGVYPPGAAPAFNPQPSQNYNLSPPINPNPGVGGTSSGGPRTTDIEDDTFGQPGQFPGSSPQSGQRPTIPPDGRFPVPDYPVVDPNSPTATAPPVNNTKVRSPSQIDLGPESFKSDIKGSKRANEKLEEIEEDGTAPMSVVPKRTTSMISNGSEDATAEFVPPITSGVARQGASNIIQTAQHVENATFRPYGRAANGQAWFRGVVDFDEQEKTWYLIYNPDPEQTDERGGIIALIEHPNLQLLKSDDIVLIEGHFDQGSADRYGHAKYRVETVQRLVAPQEAIQ